MFTMTNNHATGYCMAADTKPTEGFENGDELREMDTGKTYFFDKENGEWIEWAPAAEDDTTPEDS